MKNFFPLIFIAFITLNATSQINEQDIMNNRMVIPVYKNTPEGYTGSPFVNEDFQRGIIHAEEGKSQPALLRYNAVEGIMEIKLNQQEKKIHVLPRIEKISYTLGGHSYYIDSKRTEEGELLKGYFISYYESDKVKLLAWPRPDMTDAQVAKTGYEKDKPAHLSVDMEYYLEIGDNRLKEVRLRPRDFRKAFDNNDAMKDYLSDNKVKSLEDAIEALKFYDKQA